MEMEELKTENKGKFEKKENESYFQKAWDKFTTILTIALVAMAIYCAIGVMKQNKTGELFFPLGYRPVVILSGSMEDELHTGAIVVVEETKTVQEGDIVFFIAEDGGLVIHRYVDTDENGNMITKGDNNPKEDLEPVTKERLQGKVVMKMNWTAGPMNFFAWLGNKL